MVRVVDSTVGMSVGAPSAEAGIPWWLIIIPIGLGVGYLVMKKR